MTRHLTWPGDDRPNPAAGGVRGLCKAALVFVLLPLSTCMLHLTGRLCRFTLRLTGQRPDGWKVGAAALPVATPLLEPGQ